MYRLACCLLGIVIVTVLLLPSDKSQPATENQPKIAAHSYDAPTPMAAYRPAIAPEEYRPDVEHYWMQPWYLLCGFCAAACIFGGIFWAKREEWI